MVASRGGNVIRVVLCLGSGLIFFFQGLFILDGVISIPIALLGFIAMPDLPSTTKPSRLYSQEQLDMAKKRMDSAGRKPPAKFTKKKVQVAC